MRGSPRRTPGATGGGGDGGTSLGLNYTDYAGAYGPAAVDIDAGYPTWFDVADLASTYDANGEVLEGTADGIVIAKDCLLVISGYVTGDEGVIFAVFARRAAELDSQRGGLTTVDNTGTTYMPSTLAFLVPAFEGDTLMLKVRGEPGMATTDCGIFAYTLLSA